MMWATLLSGFVLLSVISSGLSRSISDVEKPLSRWKRSIDLNDIYYSKMRQYRLPNEVTPTSYHVDIKIPFIQSNQFNGRVKINLTWSDTNDRITLNVDPNLEISLVSVRLIPSPDAQVLNDEPYLNVARTERQNRKSWYIIHLEQMMKNGSACEVDITYFGNLTTNETTGLYKSAYMDSDGQKHPFIATYLQLDNAQKMFPCMDEPPYKATFKLSVLYPKGLTARTNTPSISRHETSDKIEEEFAETPRMSTNQLALVISDLQNIEPTKEVNEMDGKKLQVKVWGRKEFMESLLTVPNKVVMIVNYLQDYFNCSLGLPKLDVMAIPMYSTSKASDNWGIMFFRESELSSSLVWTTAYELLYQWIGQSTTPYRRNDAPVNKALNSFLASMATIDLNPNEMEGKWPMTMMYPLYYEFAQTAPFSRVAGIRQEATWTKAELVFRMFNYTLGRDLFQRSVRNFFHQQSKEDRRTFFANDIFTYLNDVANETGNLPPGLTINGIAASWINRDRVPLVTVIRDYETGKINLSQKVYLRDIPPQSTAKVSYQWDIPIVMQAQDKLNFHNAKPTVWLKKENIPKNLTITDITEKNNFIIVNPEEIGMFPVNYDSCNWKMLSDYLQGPDRENIPPLTRAKLLHDAWNLAYAGELCFGVAMNMTLFLKKEKSHIVWEPVFTMIHHIGRRIEGLDVYLKFEAYIRSLLKPLYLELGEKPRPNEPSWKTHMRGLMQNFLCRAGYEPCVKEARDQFKKWLTDEEPDKGNPVLSGCEANETSSGQEVVPSVSSLDEETLKLLGDDPEKDESEKFSLQQDLVQRWKGWISSGLKKDMLEELLKKYGRSGNCPLDAPMLNPEIMASLSEVTTKRDKHFVQSQKMIGSAMVALGTAITMLLVNNDEGIDRLQLIENLCDAGKLLAATHYKESLARRAFISPGISKPLRTTLDNSKPEVFLYGSDLQAKIKEAKSIVRVGDDLKVKIAQKQSVEKLPNKNLNFKGPPAKQRNFSSVGNRQQSQSRRRFQSRSEHHRNERSISLVEKFLIPVINVTRSVFCARSSGTENRPIIRALFRQ